MVIVSFAASLLFAFLARGHDNGLAITPAMGWNTWNHFGCNISESTILGAAHQLVNTGLKDAGYTYVNIDDCWQAPSRDNNTQAPRADPEKFPGGIKKLADEIHGLGLKIGIYSDAGKYTCGGRFGSLGFEKIDAKTYASWEIDYLKYDNCYNEGRSGFNLVSYERYLNMSNALNATDRPILYSICQWGEDQPWNWATTIANSWRISGDIFDKFAGFDDRCPCESMLDCKLPGFHCAMSRIIDFAAPLGQKAGPNHWNDLDMLEVGNGGMTKDEYVTHFTFWSILKSPLILGNDITDMTNDTLEIITNSALINISQDSLGSPAIRLWKQTQDDGELSLWQGNLANSSAVVAVLNTASTQQTLALNYSDIWADSRPSQTVTWEFFDLWQKTDAGSWGKSIGTFNGTVPDISVVPHGTRVFKAVLQASPQPSLKKRYSRMREGRYLYQEL